MSVEEFPQKLFWKKRRGQGTNFKTVEDVSAVIYTHSAHRSFSEPSTKGFSTLLFASSLMLECNFPTAIFNPENLYPRNLPRAGILVPTGMDFPSVLCDTFLFEELSWGQQPCCLEFRHSAWCEVACVRFACSAPTLRVGSPGVPLDWPLQSCSRNRTQPPSLLGSLPWTLPVPKHCPQFVLSTVCVHGPV